MGCHQIQSPYQVCVAASLSLTLTLTLSGYNIIYLNFLGRIDYFVDVTVDLASKAITCLFFQQTENCEKYCSIEYGPSGKNHKPQNWRKFTANTTTSGNVIRLFPSLNNSEQFQPLEE